MDSPTAWNVNDKSDYLSINSNGLRVDYLGMNSNGLRVDYKRTFLHKIYKKFSRPRNYLHITIFFYINFSQNLHIT